jgi:DNA-binding NarL/FixJ family response regulator
LFSEAILFLYAFLETVVLALALGRLLFNAKSIAEEKNRRAVRHFVYLNILVYSTSIALSLLSNRGPMSAAIYGLAFFSANLVPLLYWKAFLTKFAVAPSLQKIGPEVMMRFLEDYKISKREEEVIQHLCAGRTNKEISEALFISLQTVKDHIYRVYQKTDVRNRVQLINLIQSYKSEEQDIPKTS